MIRLFRQNAPEILTGKDKPGPLETAEAIAIFRKGSRKPASDFKFSAYRDKSVKEALVALSHGKCAYCESREAGSDYDIEHFRPKGEISGPGQTKRDKGYYWLAADWDNLFLSCMHCNQKRIQEFVDGPRVSSGKKNQFPLSDESKRAAEFDDDFVADESARLLLDPVRDDPAEHLAYREMEEPGMAGDMRILPMIDATVTDGKYSPKGDTSIKVFGLNRKQLVDVRVVHFNNLRSRMALINDLIRNFNEDEAGFTKEKRERRKKAIQDAMDDFATMLEDETLPYTAMTRYFNRTYLKHCVFNG